MRLAALSHDISLPRKPSAPPWAIAWGRRLFAYRNWVFAPVACGLFLHAWRMQTVPCTTFDIVGFALGAAIAAWAAAVRVGCAGSVLPDSCGRGRAFRAERLITVGWYAACRNPLYLANAMLWAAGCLFARAPWAVVPTVAFVLGMYRLMLVAEEDFLRRRFQAAYLEYCRRVPRFLPRPNRFRSAPVEKTSEHRPFSLRQAIFREHDTLALLLVGAWTLCGIAGGGWQVPRWRLMIDSIPALVFVATAWPAVKLWKQAIRRRSA